MTANEKTQTDKRLYPTVKEKRRYQELKKRYGFVDSTTPESSPSEANEKRKPTPR